MILANVELTACRSGRDASPDLFPHHGASMLTLQAQREAQKFAAELDRNSIWPTHRIRCFLLSQQYNESRAATR